MLHNQMEMLNCYVMCEKKNTLDSLKIGRTSKPPTVFATFLELPPFFLNSNKAKPGRAAAARAPAPRARQLLLLAYCLKASFLRIQKTQPQKSIRAIKKRHKLASSHGFEKAKPAPAGSRSFLSSFSPRTLVHSAARPPRCGGGPRPLGTATGRRVPGAWPEWSANCKHRLIELVVLLDL